MPTTSFEKPQGVPPGPEAELRKEVQYEFRPHEEEHAMIAAGDDDPRSLQLPTVRARRLRMLDAENIAENIAPLAQFVNGIREQIRENYPLPDYVPMFDPCDGGCAASLLVLLQSPGREAVKSGFVSRNNPDETAETLLRAMRKAAIPRKKTILWNAIPWFLGSGTRVRRPTAAEVGQSVPYLSDLLTLLGRRRRLAALVLGDVARRCFEQVRAPHRLRVFRFPHPGPHLMRRNPERFEELVGLLRNTGV
jgi:hypothetical protein